MPVPAAAAPDSAPSKRDAYAAFRSPEYRCYSIANFASSIGRQMLGVAIGYGIFQSTHSATALGLIGLMAALPIIFLSIPAGIATDRWNRIPIVLATQALNVLCSIGLVLLTLDRVTVPPVGPLPAAAAALRTIAAWCGEKNGVVFGPAIPLIYLLLFINGVGRAFGWAARSAIMPNLVPRADLSNAVMWNSSTFELSCVVGPALSGIVIAQFGCATVYGVDAGCALLCLLFILPIKAPQNIAAIHPNPLQDLFTGLRFVTESKIILATITLDLFAVLLGGALALLPMFADQILHVGATGLGWLRAAPSFGAVTMAFVLAHRRPLQRAGSAMLLAVAGFGGATIVFGLSSSYWVSFTALALTGAFDNISVVVRHTLVQLLTPDAMRGRVSAVNNIFIGSSNELGAFESGITAALFGPIASVVGGGIGTILAVLAVAKIWPQVRRIGPLQHTEVETSVMESKDLEPEVPSPFLSAPGCEKEASAKK